MLDSYRSHYKALVKLGFPIIVGQAGMIVLGFADTLMIGHHSTDELAAAAFVNNLFNFVIIFGMGFSYGLTPVVSEYYGTRRPAQAGQALRCSLLVNVLLALVLTGLMSLVYLNVERLGQPESLIPLIKPYFLILLASLVPLMAFNAFKQFTDGITDTRTGMWILLGGNVLNIIGNYLLIYGKAGFPELGLSGAGISTLVSRIVMSVVFAGVFLHGRKYAGYKAGFLGLGWSKPLLRRLSLLGYPVALQMGMESSAFNLSTIMVGWIGALALASHQVMLTVSQFTFMMFYGLGAAVAIRVSYFKSQHDTVHVRRAATAGFHLMLLLGVILCSVIFILRSHLGGWFTDNPEVSATVALLVLPFFVYQFGDGLQISYANALRGISDVKPMMVIAFIAYFVISLPMSYLFGIVLGWGVVGIWTAYPFALTSAGLMFWYRFHRKTREV